MGELAEFSATVHGRVQGVNFRYFVERNAGALGLLKYAPRGREKNSTVSSIFSTPARPGPVSNALT